MSESTLQWVQICKLLALACFAGLYGFGGIHGKWKRRFLAPALLALAIVGLDAWSRNADPNWWLMLYFPTLSAALHLGYGSQFFWFKVKKRARYGLALGCAAVPIAWVTGMWPLLVLHIVICVLVSVSLGVFNITSSPRAEETIIGVAACLMPLGMI